MHQCPLLCARCTCSIHKDESKHPFLPPLYSTKLSGDNTHVDLDIITRMEVGPVEDKKKGSGLEGLDSELLSHNIAQELNVSYLVLTTNKPKNLNPN